MTTTPSLADLAKEFLQDEHGTKPDPGPEPAPQHQRAFTKTTVRLPEPVAARLRAWASDTGRTYADAVLSSYLEGIEDLRGRCTADAQRVRLGLRPLNAPRPVAGPRVPIVFRASTAALGFVRLLVCGVFNFAGRDPRDGDSAPDRVSRALLALRPLGHG